MIAVYDQKLLNMPINAISALKIQQEPSSGSISPHLMYSKSSILPTASKK
jgi:hypothetical protein